jgi:glycosyltransferase involved in cell wall biosynthesis
MPDATAPRVSAIVICKDRLEHLKQTLPLLVAQPLHEVILVDYDCPAASGDWAAGVFPNVRVVRVKNQPLFNASAARNRGAEVAVSPWLLFIDADVCVTPGFVQTVRRQLEVGAFFGAEPLKHGIWGTIFVHRIDFDAIGGYDESFQGYGSEDVDFNDRLMAAGVEFRPYDSDLIEAIDHSDDMRTRHHEVRDRNFNAGMNEFYREIKHDIEKLEVTLDEGARHRLYAEVRRAFAGGETPPSFEVTFRKSGSYGLGWITTLKYTLTRNAR